MGAVDLSQTSSEPHTSESLESDGHTGCETSEKPESPQSKELLVPKETRPLETVAAGGEDKPAQAPRKRSRKKLLPVKHVKVEEGQFDEFAPFDAAGLIPPIDDVESYADSSLLEEDAAGAAAADADSTKKEEVDLPVVVKRKRGRPRKSESSNVKIPVKPFVAPRPPSRVLSRRLRSGGEPQYQTQDAEGMSLEKSFFSTQEDAKEWQSQGESTFTDEQNQKTEVDSQLLTNDEGTATATPLDHNSTSSFPDVKPLDQEVAANVSKQEDNQQTSLTAADGMDSEERGALKELDERMSDGNDKNEGSFNPPEESIDSIKASNLNSGQMEDAASSKTPSLVDGQSKSGNPEASSTDTAPSPEQACISTDDEQELSKADTVTPVDNASIKTEAQSKPPSRFRRKRGGKRRRRVQILSQKENVKAKPKLSEGLSRNVNSLQIKEEESHMVIDDTTGSGRKSFRCSYCGRQFRFRSHYVVHVRIHTGEKPYKCPKCGKGFTKNSNLNLHLKSHQKTDFQKCEFCSIKFPLSKYAQHMKIHELELERVKPETRSTVEGKGEELFGEPLLDKEKKICQYCGKNFLFQSALTRHLRIHTGEKPFKCDVCGKAFGQSYFLRVHELTHLSVKRYNCTRCEKSFAHYSNARNHTCRPVADRRGSSPLKPMLTYTCHICRQVFDTVHEFNAHMRAHSGAKLFRCLKCDKLFGAISEFESHRAKCAAIRNTAGGSTDGETMSTIQYSAPKPKWSSIDITLAEIETEESTMKLNGRSTNDLKKPFQSVHTAPQNLSQLALKLNKLDNRSDPRVYTCPDCGRQFRHMGRLRAHMMTHPAGRGLKCTCCGKTLGSWQKLWFHQRVHRQRHGRFTCPLCGRGFRFAGTYKRHMSEHPEYLWVKDKPKKALLPYQCEHCRCSYKTLDLLFKHQLCHSSAQDVQKTFNFTHLVDDQPSQFGGLMSGSSNRNAPSSSSLDERWSSNHTDIERSPLVSVLSPHLGVGDKSAAGNYSKSKGDSSGIQCTMCAAAFQEVSDLYEHYVQHARSQV